MNAKLVIHIFVQWLAHKGLLDLFLDALIQRVGWVVEDKQEEYLQIVIQELYDRPGEAIYVIPWNGSGDIDWSEISDEWRIFTYTLQGVIANDYT